MRTPASASPRVVRVLVDVSVLDKELDYALPEALGPVDVGTIVRVPLAGRRVRGWVVEIDVVPPDGVVLKEVIARVSAGPAPDLVDLAGWAAWRWVGRRVRFLRTASPERIARSSPISTQVSTTRGAPHTFPARGFSSLVRGDPHDEPPARGFSSIVRRVPPAADPLGVVTAELRHWCARGSVLLLVPEIDQARTLAGRVQALGLPIALMPADWEAASSGGHVVIGPRAAAWAPAPDLAGVIVIDAEQEAYREEAAPTWDARLVAEERARRAGVPFLTLSPCPPLELTEGRAAEIPSRREERAGWAPLEVVDMAAEDPRSGLYSSALVRLTRGAEPGTGRQVLCILNRRGRALIMACQSCRRVLRCTDCGSAMREEREPKAALCCSVCSASRPVVCLSCSSTAVRRLRIGVTRVVEELSALTGKVVVELTGATPKKRSGLAIGPESESRERRPSAPPIGPESQSIDRAAVVVGTEAALHRVASARAVAFLDVDQDLLAPRFGAAHHCLSLLALAARRVGGRSAAGRVLVQTRCPDDAVFTSALHGDPGYLEREEAARRRHAMLPPFAALALVTGKGAGEVVQNIFATLVGSASGPDAPPGAASGCGAGSGVAPGDSAGAYGCTVAPVAPERWIISAPSHQLLCDALELELQRLGSRRPRVEVDPVRL